MRGRAVVAAAVGLAAVGLTARWGIFGRSSAAAPPRAAALSYREFADTLRRHETLSELLLRRGLTPLEVAQVASTATLDARRLPAGLVFRFEQPETAVVPTAFEVRVGPDERVRFERGALGWRARAEAIAWVVRGAKVHGIIETSLYDALDAAVPDSLLPAEERVRLAWALAEVYDWEVDFTRDIRSGARFDVLLERLVSEEHAVRFGRVVAARLDVPRGPSYAFWFEPGAAPGGYYDEDGRSLRRAFLRAPLEYRRISSRFANSRRHPILGRWRAHLGTDYAAAYGTPVRATADGIVAVAGRESGYGNLVELRHAKGITTRYGHLSGFARGIRAGVRVRQRETVGFVGATGLATGPHLHYEFRVQGRATNPQRRDMGSGQPVPAADRDGFLAWRDRLLPYLATSPRPDAAPRVD